MTEVAFVILQFDRFSALMVLVGGIGFRDRVNTKDKNRISHLKDAKTVTNVHVTTVCCDCSRACLFLMLILSLCCLFGLYNKVLLPLFSFCRCVIKDMTVLIPV